jgi:hypothetical protein
MTADAAPPDRGFAFDFHELKGSATVGSGERPRQFPNAWGVDDRPHSESLWPVRRTSSCGRYLPLERFVDFSDGFGEARAFLST